MEVQTSSYYTDLLKKVLCDYHRANTEQYKPLPPYPTIKIRLLRQFDKYIRKKHFAICEIVNTNQELRTGGLDWPLYAETMIGMKRMDNLEYCVRDVIKNKVEGDFIETGVWRGGAVILIRAILKELNITDRIVWVADSFEGLPKPDSDKYPADLNDGHHTVKELSISLDEVKENFKKYNLLDDRVKFLKGWFKDTLLSAPINKLAILRLDGDMYESTMDGLKLYPKLSKGGYIIVDDWGAVPACKQAIEDYRAQNNITEKIMDIDGKGIYWQKLN
jgi:O-methyltransferase